MKLSARQKAILYGLALGDGYLQKTGRENARLRIEHSYKQREYVFWKYKELSNLFAAQPKKIERVHPVSKQTYTYLRLQSHSSPLFGRLRGMLYDEEGRRKFDIKTAYLLKSALTLAVWYMDDGYYDRKDKSAHIYLPKFTGQDRLILVETFVRSYGIQPRWYCRPDRKGCQLNFTGEEKDTLFRLINVYILPMFSYKLPLTP